MAENALKGEMECQSRFNFDRGRVKHLRLKFMRQWRISEGLKSSAKEAGRS